MRRSNVADVAVATLATSSRTQSVLLLGQERTATSYSQTEAMSY